MPYVQAGKLKALAVTGARRSQTPPDLPTVAESGLRGYEAVGWFGLLAPAATPKAIVAKLNQAMADYLHSPEGIAQMKAIGAEAVGSTPMVLNALIKYESALWAEVIRTGNLTIQ